MHRFHTLFALLLVISTLARAQEPDDESIWTNYDFVPGDTILFFHDFEGTRVGNFPSRVGYLEGAMEVVALPDGNHVLRTQNEGRLEIPLGQPFPERYTVEFRVRTTDAQGRIRVLLYSAEDRGTRKAPGAVPIVQVSGREGTGLTTGRYQAGPKAVTESPPALFLDQWADVRIAVDGPYWKVYLNEQRVANVPRVEMPPAEAFRMYMSIYPYDGKDLYLDDLRVAAGGPRSLYDDLLSQGFIATQGIYFDVNRADILPHSMPTLLQMEAMMKAHPDLKIRIEGHTDSTGGDDVNGPLSARRAGAVRVWLIEHGVPAERMTTEGLGATRPVAPNDTPEGRARNRRTEVHLLQT